MNTSTPDISSLRAENGAPPIICALQSFGSRLRSGLGESAWSRLTPAIRRRFSGYISETQALRFRGRMHWVFCSPLGSLIMRLLARNAILPARCARDVEFDFQIGMHHNAIVKQRRYRFDPEHHFIFRSVFGDLPDMHEEFSGGIGMYLELLETQGGLLFRDRGYFLRIFRWRLPLPRWLSVGRFELLHRNLDVQRYQIIIRVAHPLLGTLFYQRGIFTGESP